MDTDTIVLLVAIAVWGLVVYLSYRADINNQIATQKAWRERSFKWDEGKE